MKMNIVSILIALLLSASVANAAAEPEPGDSCRKEGESVLLIGGDGLTCTKGKYAATMIGPNHSAGASCWGIKGAELKPDKFGMVCKNGKFQHTEEVNGAVDAQKQSVDTQKLLFEIQQTQIETLRVLKQIQESLNAKK